MLHGKGHNAGILQSSLATLGISSAGSNARKSAQLRLTSRLAALGVAQDDSGWNGRLGGKSLWNHLICPATKSYKLLEHQLLDTRWSK